MMTKNTSDASIANTSKIKYFRLYSDIDLTAIPDWTRGLLVKIYQCFNSCTFNHN